MNKLAIGAMVLALSTSVPAVAADSPPLRLLVQPEQFVMVDDCDEVCEFEHTELSPRIQKDRRHAIPGFVRPMNEDAFGWYQIPTATSLDWYSANVLGNVYDVNHVGVIADVNWDGYADQVFLIEIITPRDQIQIISVWLADPVTGSYWTHAEHLNGIYNGLEVDRGDILLTTQRRGRTVYEQWFLPLD